MSPHDFDAIARVSRLAVIQSLMASIASEAADDWPDLKTIHFSMDIDSSGIGSTLTYIGANGVVIAEQGL